MRGPYSGAPGVNHEFRHEPLQLLEEVLDEDQLGIGTRKGG